jgi:hypothetical protein
LAQLLYALNRSRARIASRSLAFGGEESRKGELMTRREIVVLVSRALAIIQLMTAVIEITYLPLSLFSLFHHLFPLQSSPFGDYWSRYYMEALLALIARIAILLLAALLLWKCGPKVEALLLSGAATPEANLPQT